MIGLPIVYVDYTAGGKLSENLWDETGLNSTM